MFKYSFIEVLVWNFGKYFELFGTDRGRRGQRNFCQIFLPQRIYKEEIASWNDFPHWESQSFIWVSY